MALCIFKTNSSIQLIEQPDLRETFGLVGIQLPSRKQLIGPVLDRAYARVKTEVAEARRKAGGVGALASDGCWRKRAAEQGTPLVNFMLLLPTGSLFLKVITAAGVRKDARYIAQVHLDMVAEAFEKFEDCIGFVMDNTSTNLKAMGILRDTNCRWLTVGCGAHGLALLFKDLAKEKHCSWAAKIINTVIMISTVVGDSERIRTLLGKHQVEKNGKKSAITANSTTRFACCDMILGNVLANEEALKAMVCSKEA